MRTTLIFGCCLCLLPACSGGSSSGQPTTQGGASSSSGGTAESAHGGAARGGASNGGTGSGGAPSETGGSATRGGSSSGSGGTSNAGGTSSTGGTSSSSGGTSSGRGGAPSGGGGNAVGGSNPAGGSNSVSGGASASGGRQSNGGNNSAGGAAAGATNAGGSTAKGGATGASGAPNPGNGALLGAYVGEGTVEASETQIGRKWAIQLQYFDWPSDFTEFAQTTLGAGRTPYVTWEPWSVTLDAIASGAEDTTIRARAASIAKLNGKVMLRFAHEMNGNWYPWDGADNGASASAPPKYTAAYRHIHDVFATAGVSNVLWVFCPNVDSVPNESWNAWQNYYPGDSYVDWMGYDGYNWGTDSFEAMTTRIYSSLAAKNKPIMLGETSTKDAEKATWISAILPAMKSKFPMLKALVWFQVNKENDWRYNSTQNSLSAFVSMAKDPYFNP